MEHSNRNDCCWCGSGLKLQECHLATEEQLHEYQRQGYTIPTRRWLKTARQIDGIRESGRLTTEILDRVAELIEPGASTAAIDDWVHRFTLEHDAYPAPLNYKGFPKSCCISVNEVICHGIPSERQVLRPGDIVNVDVTTILNGYYSDANRMYLVGTVDEAGQRLVQAAKECMEIGVRQVRPLGSLNDIGNAIEPFAVTQGYSVVRDLGGHGIGLAFHEPIHVDHFRKRSKGYLLLPGLVFTVEPMINQGTFDCRFLADGWTVVTRDGKLSAQWEQTVAVTAAGVEVLAR